MEQAEHEPGIQTIIPLTKSLSYDIVKRTVLLDKTPKKPCLSERQHELFSKLLFHPDNIITYQELFESLNPNTQPVNNIPEIQYKHVKTYILHLASQLKKKLASLDLSLPDCIENIRGVGYSCHL